MIVIIKSALITSCLAIFLSLFDFGVYKELSLLLVFLSIPFLLFFIVNKPFFIKLKFSTVFLIFLTLLIFVTVKSGMSMKEQSEKSEVKNDSHGI